MTPWLAMIEQNGVEQILAMLLRKLDTAMAL